MFEIEAAGSHSLAGHDCLLIFNGVRLLNYSIIICERKDGIANSWTYVRVSWERHENGTLEWGVCHTQPPA